jgi:hypothetical protein
MLGARFSDAIFDQVMAGMIGVLRLMGGEGDRTLTPYVTVQKVGRSVRG